MCRSLRAAEWIAWPKVRRSFDLPSTWILVEDTSPIWKPRTLRKKQSASPGAPSLPIGGHGETTFADLEGSTRAAAQPAAAPTAPRCRGPRAPPRVGDGGVGVVVGRADEAEHARLHAAQPAAPPPLRLSPRHLGAPGRSRRVSHQPRTRVRFGAFGVWADVCVFAAQVREHRVRWLRVFKL